MKRITKTSDRIKESLRINSMRQVDLVKKTGINKSSISLYIAGGYEPKHENLMKMADALNVNENWLYGYDVAMK